jgi:hypothetical protein
MISDRHEYTTEDFSAVNSYVNHLAEKNRAGVREIRARNFGEYAKWGAVALVAAGIAAALVMWGISFLKDYEIVEKQIVVKEPANFKPTIIVNTPATVSEAQRTRNVATSRTRELQETSPSITDEPGVKPVFNFTIFKSMPFNIGEIDDVVVGMTYEDSNSAKPSHQWCYITAPNKDGTHTRVNLAIKEATEIRKAPLPSNVAAKLGISEFELERAQGLCSFE